MQILTEDDVICLLQSACEAAGGQRAWARSHGLSYKWVNTVIRKRAGVPASVSMALGMRKVTVFEPLRSSIAQ